MSQGEKQSLISLEELLERIKLSLLIEFAEGQGVKFDHAQDVPHVILTIITKMVSKGVERFFEVIPMRLLKKIIKEMSLNLPTKLELPWMAKTIGERMDEYQTLGDFFSNLSKSLLLEFLRELKVPLRNHEYSKTELEDILENEIVLQGAYECFDFMTRDYTLEVGHKLGLSRKLQEGEMIFQILGFCFPHCTNTFGELTEHAKHIINRVSSDLSEESDHTGSVVIRQGITKQELSRMFWKELYVFCSDNHINPTGKKDDLANRIITFLQNQSQPSLEASPSKKKKLL